MTTIVKVQLPLATSEPKPKAMIYNKDRSVHMFTDVDMVKNKMGKEKKLYFNAIVDGDSLTLLERAPWQSW
jgi:hypothetical protein